MKDEFACIVSLLSLIHSENMALTKMIYEAFYSNENNCIDNYIKQCEDEFNKILLVLGTDSKLAG